MHGSGLTLLPSVAKDLLPRFCCRCKVPSPPLRGGRRPRGRMRGSCDSTLVGWDQRLISRAGPPDHALPRWAGARVARWSHPTLSDANGPIKYHSRRCLLMAAVIGALLFVPSRSIAQTVSPNDERAQVDLAGLDIQALAGWDGTVDTSAPVPFSFLISNFTEDVIEGQLILTDPLNNKEVTLGEIFIGPNSVRRFSSIQAVPDWFQCIATFSKDDIILWRRELIITTGKDFSEDINYLLFVDDGGRMLQWPVDESASGSSSSSRFVPKPGQGRPVQPLAVKSWQVPQHHGPLTVAQAMVFSETADPDMLNAAQWEAIAKWMCLGGTVFVSETSTEVINRLTKAAPLAIQPAIRHERLLVHRCGGGSVREYSGRLFSVDDPETHGLIAEAAAQLSRSNTMSLLDQTDLDWSEAHNAETTRMLVIAVFGFYTLMSGVVTLLLFRLNRRQTATYTGIVVFAACVASAVLGGMLRSSEGDLRWVTVTQAGPGGLVQLARIDVQSAGGRNSRVAVRGRHADLQLIESDTLNFQGRHYYYYGYGTPESAQIHYPPFSWQANLLPDESDAWKINVPITPWGYRRTYSAAFDPAVSGLEIKLKYEPPEEPVEIQVGQYPHTNAQLGQFTLTATNHLPFDLTECQLVVGTTGVSLLAGEATESYDPRTGRLQMRNGTSVGELFPVESMAEFGELPRSKIVTDVAISMSRSSLDNQGLSFWRDPRWSRPRIAYDGATSAWIVGRISRSPVLSIDEQNSDFKPLQELHMFVQEILPEDMPEAWLRFHQLHLSQQIESAAQVDSP